MSLRPKKPKSAFEDRIETLDSFKVETSSTLNVRELISRDY